MREYEEIKVTLSDFATFAFDLEIPEPTFSPKLSQLAADFVPEIVAIEPKLEQRYGSEGPRVSLASQLWFQTKWTGPTTGYIAGWFRRHENVIELSTPWRDDDLLNRSVLLHETVHWLQNSLGTLINDRYASEEMAWRTQMIWLTKQGFDVRKASWIFNGDNLFRQTNADLAREDYAFLKPYETKENVL